MRLIDADALTEVLETMAKDEWNQQVGSSKGLEDAIDVIDNAPTVDAYPFEQVQELINLNQQFAQEIENMKKALNLKRPQGEWIQLNDYDYRCTICGNTMMDKWDYCPSCGADMRKETDNDRMA